MTNHLSRRDFLGLPWEGSGWTRFAWPAAGNTGRVCGTLPGADATWAQALLKLQVVDATRDDSYGGILCPTRKIVHGRVGDTIYPFMHMARRTGDHGTRCLGITIPLDGGTCKPAGRILAERDQGFVEGNNVFTTIALCEAIRYHGDLMEPAFRRPSRTG